MFSIYMLTVLIGKGKGKIPYLPISSKKKIKIL